MPRIDPLQLLKILSVLLAPNGGIKSKDEVPRLASLMTKFSKKLVSKCIYVSILKVTEPEMLVMWMSAGGWDLIYNWLNDGVETKNWPLVNELVELLLVCPVDIERLKTNRCPKLIKTLSKNPDATEAVRQHAAEIVKKWLMVVNEVLTKQKEEAPEHAECQLADGPIEIVEGRDAGDGSNTEADGDSQLPVYRIIIRDGKEVLTEVSNKDRAKGVAGSLEDDDEEKEDENEDDDDDEEFVLDGSKVLKSGAKGAASAKRNLKVKKTLELDVANKALKIDKSNDGSEASTSGVDQERPSVVLNRNKSDPARDRRKDKMRQIRKDPDGDVYFESRPIADEKPLDKMKNKKVSGVKSSHTSDKLKSGSKSGSSSVSGSGNSKSGVASKSGAGASQIKPIITKSPDISKLGKIPKKSKSDGGDKKDKVSASSDKKDKDAGKPGAKSEKEDSKSSTKKPEIKKPPAPPPPKIEKDSKKYNISVEPRKVAPGETRPKTVKTFNSKFRSTGLEEELPPPPQPKSVKKNLPTGGDKKPLKRISPPKEPQPPEKKPKTVEPVVLEAAVVPPAPVPVIEKEMKPAKPKMQLSDSFMDALNAATVMKEPRKRKRRMSGSKDPDKKDPSEPESPTQSPQSPALVKPNFKFYQDTLESDDASKTGEEDKKKIKVEKDNEKEAEDGNDSNSENRTPSPVNEVVINTEEEIKNEKNRQNSEGLRGVLIFAKLRKGPKKKVSWRGELEDIKFFELDENERVNVTKTFLDAKQMERIHERENFAIARKLTNEDVMEEKIRWKVLIPCDSPNLGVIAGNNSAEKEIQYAREKTVPAAFYFNKRLIPDSPAEPDLEIHATTDPTIIPLEDISGNEDSINDFTSTPWPESKNPSPPQQEPLMVGPPGPIMPTGPIPNFGPGPVGPAGPGFSPNAGPGLMGPGPGPVPGPVPNMGFGGFGGPPVPPFGPPQPGPPPGMGMMPPGDWRGPGQDMKGPGPMPPDLFGPPGPPGMMGPPGLLPPPDLPFGMQPPGPMPGPPDDMNFPGGPFNMNQGPGGPPNMFQGPPFQGNNGGNNNGGNNNNNQGGGNWYRSNGPGGRHDDDRGNDKGSRSDRGNYRNRDRGGGRNEGRGSGGGSWRSGRGSGGDKWGGGGGGGKNSICNNYARWGNCRSNNCPYRHPYKD